MGSGLPFAIEKLLVLERPDGSKRVQLSGAQILTPVHPANYVVDLNVVPTSPTYAHINYILGFSSSMVPDAFHVKVLTYGQAPIDGVLSADWLQREHAEMYVVETISQPTFLRITNRTNVAQYYESTVGYIVIQTEEDFNVCMEELLRIGTSSKVEKLLSAMERKLK